MASINVPSAWVAGGYLPPICARHGTPATQRIKRAFYSDPPWWLLILIPFTLLLTLIIALAIRKTVNGSLPGCDTCTAERKRFLTRVWMGWGLSVALLVSAIALHSGAVGLVWLLLQVVVLIETFRADSYRVQGKVTRDGVWVELKGAEEQFVQELNRGLANPAPSPPPAPVPAPSPPPQPQASGPVADWYPEPSGGPGLRYWDGQAWTTHTQ